MSEVSAWEDSDGDDEAVGGALFYVGSVSVSDGECSVGTDVGWYSYSDSSVGGGVVSVSVGSVGSAYDSVVVAVDGVGGSGSYSVEDGVSDSDYVVGVAVVAVGSGAVVSGDVGVVVAAVGCEMSAGDGSSVVGGCSGEGDF